MLSNRSSESRGVESNVDYRDPAREVLKGTLINIVLMKLGQRTWLALSLP